MAVIRMIFPALFVFLRLFSLSEQQSCFPGCSCSADGVSLICTNLNSVPTVSSSHKILDLSFSADSVNIPSGSFSGLRDMVSIKISGAMGVISGGAFYDIIGRNQSEFIIDGVVATIQSRAFQNITNFNEIKLTTILISTIQQFGFMDITTNITTIDAAIIFTIETYAFENVRVFNNFKILGSTIEKVKSCGFGGATGPANNFFIRSTAFSNVAEYGFGGISDFQTFELYDVTIGGADEKGLQGMTSGTDVILFGNGNDFPVAFDSPGVYHSDIRIRCLGYDDSAGSPSTTTTKRPIVKSSILAINGSRPTPTAPGATKQDSTDTNTTDAPGNTQTTNSSTGYTGDKPRNSNGNDAKQGSDGGNNNSGSDSGSNNSNNNNNTNNNSSAPAAPNSGASTGEGSDENWLDTFMIPFIIVVLVLLIIIIIILVVLLVLVRKNRKNRVEPDGESKHDVREDAMIPDTQTYYYNNQNNSQETLVPPVKSSKSKRSSRYKTEMPESAETAYPRGTLR